MSKVWRVAAAFAVLTLGAPLTVAVAQEADPIGALLEQAPPTAPVTPAPDIIPTSPSTPAPAAPLSAPSVQTPILSVPESSPTPVPSAPVVTAPPVSTAPPPAAYIPPPVYNRPAAVQAPLPYVNTPPVYTPPAYVPPVYTPPPRRPQLTAPVHIDEIGKTPEAPPTATDLNYEARMRSSFNSAQGMQGPLDGAWSLKAGGSELYDLQLVDTGSGNIEGAGRDPRRRGATDASGFIDTISRVGGQLTIRLTPRPGADPSIVVLSADSNGTWSGELNERGERRSVTMRRN